MDRTPEIRELRYFLAVAAERHFGRAAERIGIAQPALSRAVRGLEARLGVTLLERTSRGAELTAAGAVLETEARAVVAAAEAAARRARRAAQTRPRLRVAAQDGADGGLLASIMEDFPEADVVLGGWGEQADQLRDGRADVALLHLPFDMRGLDHEVVLEEPRVVALPAGHHLAGLDRAVTLQELTGEPLPRWSEDDAIAIAWCASEPETGRGRRAGVPQPAPLDRPAAADLTRVLALVALRQAVAFVPASLAEQRPHPGVAFQPVDGLTPVRLAVAWPEASRSPAVAAFVRAALSAPAAPRA
jgi:DNA-binding transcriptional LysR family regulator